MATSTKNYFRVGTQTFFFDERDPHSIWDAWERASFVALEVGGRPAVYRAVALSGPWSQRARLVGVNPARTVQAEA